MADSAVAGFDPRSREFLLDPHAAFQPLFEEASVFFCEALNAYYVLRYDDVKRGLEDFETYSSLAYKGMPVRADLRDRFVLECSTGCDHARPRRRSRGGVATGRVCSRRSDGGRPRRPAHAHPQRR